MAIFEVAATTALHGVARAANTDGAEVHLSDVTTPVRTARSQRALRLLAAFRALRRDQLETLLLGAEQLTREARRVAVHRVVVDLRERGLLVALALAGPAGTAARAYALTPLGKRAFAASDPTYPGRGKHRSVSVVQLDHALALADIALRFRDTITKAGNIRMTWECDWEAATRLGSMRVVPDALVTLQHDVWRTRAFIEADRSTEPSAAFADKVRRYVELYRGDSWRNGMRAWPLVLTVTTTDAHARSLAALTQRVATDEGGGRIARSFRFTHDAELRSAGPLAAIWCVGGEPMRAPMIDDPRVTVSSVIPDTTAIVSAPDARSPERKGTELNLENFTGGIYGA